ncbi:molybdate ABC transporter substrate-binding protein [Pseudomaricurvus sp.]|uniref:molybdate ABC transporter substrate-binding protein n=1 Tax=Pseudomaricurvus sp. TaxID=2004510 RepID=UPI003F6D23B6
MSCVLLGSLMTSLPLHAEDINVAVASNFTKAMTEVIQVFEQSTGHDVKLSFGASGKLYAQISHGAPFQAFFSADQSKPIALEQTEFAIKGSRITYAEGSLALWSAKNDFVNLEEKTLGYREFHKLALANPRLAPYGQAAVEVLTNLNLMESTQKKWVQGENISQTYQFVSSGNAELGFVALSQILRDGKIDKGSAWIIPHELYNPIRQDAVLLKKGEKSKATQALMAFIVSDEAREIIESHGYKTGAAQP